MADQKAPELPDESELKIEARPENSGLLETHSAGADADDKGTVTIEDTALVTEKKIAAPKRAAERAVRGSGSPATGLADRFREGREQIANQAGDKARGLVTQGLERTAETLANVSKMVGDTVPGIQERLGPEYGDYARRAAGAIDNVANAIASKDPDELIEDTRTFVRNSPGIALAGAAVVGFVLARLVKSGLAKDEDDDY
jgi:ElaB/YqjD/DUF883 family membrane-anchored ribosome-binding protein